MRKKRMSWIAGTSVGMTMAVVVGCISVVGLEDDGVLVVMVVGGCRCLRRGRGESEENDIQEMEEGVGNREDGLLA